MFPFYRVINFLFGGPDTSKNRWQVTHDGEIRIIQRPQADVPGNQLLPVTPPMRDFQPETRRAILADALVEMHHTAADAWHAWQREPIPFEIARQARETGRMVAAEQQERRILVVDDLPLMGNPYAPEYATWHRDAVRAIYDGYEGLSNDGKRWLRRLCTITPERVGLHIAIWYPARAERWRGATAAQVLPILAGLAVNTLRPLCKLPYECITDMDPHLTPFVASAGCPGWRLEVYEADPADELEMAG